MHLNKLLEQIKRHQSPTEAIDKLATALEKHEGSLLEKGFTILKSELAANMYEAINGPHFDEEHARYAVEGMENEDGTKGPHWTVEETTSVANQMGINLKSEKHNKWDWFVAMNMIYSDFYKQAINGNKDAINTLSTNLNCDVKSIDNALCSIQNAIGKVGGEVGFSAERVINAVNAGDCNVIKAISDCCCTTQRSIDSVNLNLTQMNADNRLSICQQTNTLQNAITSGFNTLSSENATRFNILGAKIDAQTQIINDKFCQLEMREMQNKIDTLRDEKNALQSSALLQQQTSNIVSQIRPCPVPAYLTCNPYGCNGGLNGYGYGYPYGYGDSCCA